MGPSAWWALSAQKAAVVKAPWLKNGALRQRSLSCSCAAFSWFWGHVLTIPNSDEEDVRLKYAKIFRSMRLGKVWIGWWLLVQGVLRSSLAALPSFGIPQLPPGTSKNLKPPPSDVNNCYCGDGSNQPAQQVSCTMSCICRVLLIGVCCLALREACEHCPDVGRRRGKDLNTTTATF